MVVLSLYKKTQVAYTQYVDNDVYVDDVDDDEAGAGAHFFALRRQWMDHSQSRGQSFLLNVSRLQSTACRLLFDSVSRTNLSTECLNAEPFKSGPECLPCFESSNVLLDEVLPKGCGHP